MIYDFYLTLKKSDDKSGFNHIKDVVSKALFLEGKYKIDHSFSKEFVSAFKDEMIAKGIHVKRAEKLNDIRIAPNNYEELCSYMLVRTARKINGINTFTSFETTVKFPSIVKLSIGEYTVEIVFLESRGNYNHIKENVRKFAFLTADDVRLEAGDIHNHDILKMFHEAALEIRKKRISNVDKYNRAAALKKYFISELDDSSSTAVVFSDIISNFAVMPLKEKTGKQKRK